MTLCLAGSAVAGLAGQVRVDERAAVVEAELLAQARDTTGEVRARAMSRINDLRDPSDRVVRAMIRGLSDPVCDVWEEAVLGLQDIAERRGVLDALERASRRREGATLEPVVDPRDWTSCHRAIENTIQALAEISHIRSPGKLDRVDRILAELLRDPDPFVRHLTLEHLPESVGPRLLGALRQTLWAEEPWFRGRAASLLRGRGDTTSTAVRVRLEELALDSLAEARQAAMTALLAFRPAGRAAVERLLASPRREVRIEAAVAIDGDAVPDSLQAVLSDLAGCGATRIIGGPMVVPDSLAGTYRLVMAGAGSVRDAFDEAAPDVDSLAAGTMELWALDTLHRWSHDSTGQRRLSRRDYSPLGGATDLDVARLGISGLDRPLSQRGDRPGIWTTVPLPDGVPVSSFRLMVGTEIGLDAPSLSLRVRAASMAGFRGTWTYGARYPHDGWSGLFCTVRVGR